MGDAEKRSGEGATASIAVGASVDGPRSSSGKSRASVPNSGSGGEESRSSESSGGAAENRPPRMAASTSTADTAPDPTIAVVIGTGGSIALKDSGSGLPAVEAGSIAAASGAGAGATGSGAGFVAASGAGFGAVSGAAFAAVSGTSFGGDGAASVGMLVSSTSSRAMV